MTRLRIAYGVVFVLAVCLWNAAASAADKPNVILFIGDDISWNDRPQIPTR